MAHHFPCIFSGHCDSKLILSNSKRLKPLQLLLFDNAYTSHVLLCHSFNLGHLAMDVRFPRAPDRHGKRSKALRFLDIVLNWSWRSKKNSVNHWIFWREFKKSIGKANLPAMTPQALWAAQMSSIFPKYLSVLREPTQKTKKTRFCYRSSVNSVNLFPRSRLVEKCQGRIGVADMEIVNQHEKNADLSNTRGAFRKVVIHQ